MPPSPPPSILLIFSEFLLRNVIQEKAGLCGIKRGTAQCYTAGRAQRSMCFAPQKSAYDFSKKYSEEIALIRQGGVDQLSTFPLLFAYAQYKEQKRVFRLRRFYLFRESIFPSENN